MADTKNPITVGGEYVEDPDFVPNPLDQTGQYRTDGTGASGHPEDVSPVYAVDKVKTAQEILAAVDPDNKSVGADKVLLPGEVDADTALENITALAQKRVDDGVVIGGPTPSEEAAALDGDEGAYAAQQQIAEQSRANSTGGTDAGKHDAGGQKYAGTDDDTKTAAQAKESGSSSDDSFSDSGSTPTLSDDSSKASDSSSDSSTSAVQVDSLTGSDETTGPATPSTAPAAKKAAAKKAPSA